MTKTKESGRSESPAPPHHNVGVAAGSTQSGLTARRASLAHLRESTRRRYARLREWAERQRARGPVSRLVRLRLRTAIAGFGTRRWVALAFRDFVATDGDREAMLSKLTDGMGVLLRLFEGWRSDRGEGRQLAEGLLGVCTAIDDGKVWHKDLKLRSYTDVSVQVKALRMFVERLSSLRGSKGRVDSLNLTALILDHFPTSRAALLVRAELLLERGELDSAVEAIQRALRVQAVCPTAEQLLMRAYQAKRDAGSKDEALSVLDYDLSDKFCHIPFTYLSTGWKGAAHLCSCPAWVPFPVGNVLSAESADAVWNSAAASEVRRSILDGDFTYCSRTLCSFITAQKLPRKDEIEDPTFRRYIDDHLTALAEPPAVVELNYDATCNLACPSCRTEIVTAKADEQDSYSRATDRVILPLLKGAKGAYICGGGEAFASKHFRAILAGLNRREYPSLRLHLITNGLLVTPQRWKDFPDLAEMIGAMSVSIDAAKAETYEKLRRPGKWATLMSNLEFIAGMRMAGKIPQLWINFVVQKENYREMIDFVELGSRLGVDQVWFQRVTNYGAYGEATFAEIDVTSPSHPEHAGLLEILRDPLLRSPLINRQMLMSLLPEVVSSDERLEYLYRNPETLIML